MSEEANITALSWREKLDRALQETIPSYSIRQRIQDLAAAEMEKAIRPDGETPLKLLTADEILTTDWPEPRWAIPGLLPVGLTILAGRPKIGKSWLALQIAQSVASGGYALGEHVEQGPILYLALEDTGRRLKDRMGKLGWPKGLNAEFMLLGEFKDKIDDLRNGGGERLGEQMALKQYRLVVIDTLSRACYGDQSDVEEMTAALAPIHEMAHATNTGVLLNDHHRKFGGYGPDAVADILGSTAKGGMADTCWGLYRELGKSGAKLAIVGRDVEERTLALHFDGLTGCWQCEGDADDLEMTERRQEIVDVLQDLGKVGLVTIVDALGLDKREKGHIHSRLQDLVGTGKILREKKGRQVYYSLPESNNLL